MKESIAIAYKKALWKLHKEAEEPVIQKIKEHDEQHSVN